MQSDEITKVPLVSVVMCTYNGIDFIKEQLDSLCKQSYHFIELIISDDNSTDPTYSVLQEYAATDQRIKLYRNEITQGYIRNFSLACSYAKGTYIAFSDQDDIWHPDKIKRIVENWLPGVPLMYCNSVRFTGKDIPWKAVENRRYRRFEGVDSRKLAIFNTISGHALIAKKEFIDSLLPFPEQLMYDWWSGVVAACNGGVGYLNEILVFQRVHGLNASIGKGFSHNEKKYKPLFNKMVNNHLGAFANCPNMPVDHNRFYNKLFTLWNEALPKDFSWNLFLFLIKNRIIIFWYKRKKIGFISHIKHSYLLAKN